MSKPAPGQLNLFPPDQRSAGAPPPIPPPARIAATVTEQLPADLVAAGWRIIWRTERYNDGFDVSDSTELVEVSAERLVLCRQRKPRPAHY